MIKAVEGEGGHYGWRQWGETAAMFFDFAIWRRIDLRSLVVVISLMLIGMLTIASTTQQYFDGLETIWTPFVVHQLEWLLVGACGFFLVAAFDYRRLREWTWPMYGLMLILLVGLFVVEPIQGVHRWYRLPGMSTTLQPSEYAKLVMIVALAWFLERQQATIASWQTSCQALLICAIPFMLIARQPDLGSAIVLMPIALAMLFVAGGNQRILRIAGWLCAVGLVLSALFFLEIIPHEAVRPWASMFLKEYQIDRLAPNSYHQRASSTAVAIGGLTGAGWGRSEYTGRGWLPAAATDSIFSAFAEEFGLAGVLLLLLLIYSLLALAFYTAASARDSFGRYIATGIAAYLAAHIMINIGMMLGCLPITGVPLPLVSYGGSSLLATLLAVGLLQSIYVRRFLF